jgi:hypothetical protein
MDYTFGVKDYTIIFYENPIPYLKICNFEIRYWIQRYTFSFYNIKKHRTCISYRCSAFLFFGMTHTAAYAFASYKLANAYLQVATLHLQQPCRCAEHLRERGDRTLLTETWDEHSCERGEPNDAKMHYLNKCVFFYYMPLK